MLAFYHFWFSHPKVNGFSLGSEIRSVVDIGSTDFGSINGHWLMDPFTHFKELILTKFKRLKPLPKKLILNISYSNTKIKGLPSKTKQNC